ncbi:MAG: hypothetical protein Q9222_001143 [Ikaeria aurantiellina]
MASPNVQSFGEETGHSSLDFLRQAAAATLGGTKVVFLVGLFIACLLIWNAIGRIRVAYFSPLRHLPGPWHAHLTGLVLKFHILYGNRVNYVQSLHEKYGPYVRVAHNEVVTCDAAAAKQIHAVGTRWRLW